MKVWVDPSLHIIDTPQTFIITTQQKNLKANISQQQRQQTYTLLQQLKDGEDPQTYLDDPTCFEAKMIKLLLHHQLISYTGPKHHQQQAVWQSIPTLVGPSAFLELVSTHLPVPHTLERDGEYTLLSPENSSHRGERMYIHVSNRCLYLDREPLSRKVQNDIPALPFLRYATYVFLEKLENEELQHSDDELIKVDLTLYTNEITRIQKRKIDETCFEHSLYAEETLSGYRLTVDYERFFPLVYTALEQHETETVHAALGFDQTDAFRNLIFLLEELGESHPVQRSQKSLPSYKLDRDTFIQKFYAVYFADRLTMKDEENGKRFCCQSGKINIPHTLKVNANSCFLTILLNETLKDREGVTMHGIEILQPSV